MKRAAKQNLAKKIAVFLIVAFVCPVFSQNSASLGSTKKQADKLFDDEEYVEAYRLYSQLVSNYPKDPEFNYRLGVCMIYGEPDKKKCIPYLKFAVDNQSEVPKDAVFYLGKAYHINYRFDDAIKYYTEFTKTGSSSQQKKLQVNREIAACNNGKTLLKHLSGLQVQTKKVLPENDYFRSYDLKNIGGKLLVKPDEFKTSVDKKKKDKSIVFMPKGGNTIYYSSYGNNTETGKDIYTITKMPNGTYGNPQKLPFINTEYDEDYPFMHPDGKTLYFASKGYNSMGGYDIFKSVYNASNGSWSTPVNLEFPINSPDDDFLFVTDSLEQIACFSTGRQSPPGKIDVLKISTERRPIDVLVIKGTVEKGNEKQSVNSVITVKNIENSEMIGTFFAGDKGDYNLELPNGANLLFTVRTPGQETQSDKVNLPKAESGSPFKQTITYENGILRIKNDFDQNIGDDNYLHYLELIEKQAKLDVNESPKRPTVVASVESETKNASNVSKTEEKPKTETLAVTETTTTTSTSSSSSPKQNINNKQLADMAKQDAAESKTEAMQLERDSQEAFEFAEQQRAEADRKMAEAAQALAAAENISDEDEKQFTIEKANDLQLSAENQKATAEKINAYAVLLKDDAQNKRKEAELNEQYAKELDKALKTSNNASLAKLETLQKQIDEVSQKKPAAADLADAMKANVEEKEKQIEETETANEELRSNVRETKSLIAAKEIELMEAKKKNDKKELTELISKLKAEQAEKEKQIALNDNKITNLNAELVPIKTDMEAINKIKTEDIALASNNNNNSGTKTEKVKSNNVVASANTNNTKQQAKETIKETPLKETKENSVAEEQPTNNKEQAQPQQEQQTSSVQEKEELTNTSGNVSASTQTFDPKENKELVLNQLSAENTTPAELAKQFSDSKPAVQNQQAQSQLSASLRELQGIDKEQKMIETQLENYTGGNITRSSEDLKSKAKDFKNTAEQLNSQAAELRREVKSLSGEEKIKQMNRAKNLEEQALASSLQAAIINQHVNEAEYKASAKAITEMLAKLRKDKYDYYVQLQEKNNSLASLQSQVQTLRDEALTFEDTGSRLGTMSNAEDKENSMLQQQADILKKLMQEYPSFKVEKPDEITMSNEPPSFLLNRKEQLKTQQYSELANLTNAFNTEYEASKNLVPKNLNEENAQVKQTADELNEEAARLLKQANREEDETEKTKLLTMAAKSGNAAVERLNSLIPAEVFAANSKNNSGGRNKGRNKNNREDEDNSSSVNEKPFNRNPGGRTVHVEGLDVIRGNAYSDDKPIPVDAPMQDGLVFRVQIGAFRNPLPNNTFKGLNPVNAQTTQNGYYRYTAGNFTQFELANALKNDLRNLGYSDAFVVGYYNGKRIGINEAVAMLEKEGKRINSNDRQTAGVTENANIPKAIEIHGSGAFAAQQKPSETNYVVVTKELEQTQNLLFTIQIGVFGKTTAQNIFNLKPVYTEALPNGVYRHTAGIYNNVDRLLRDKQRVVDLGIKDAFVSAYLGGKRISFTEAKRLQAEDKNIRMETENPIVFSSGNTVTEQNTTPTEEEVSLPANITPIKNGVTTYPAETPENGVKATEDGICFKVQIGAYSNEVPQDVAQQFMQIKNWPIEYKRVNNLYIFNAGNFTAARFAHELKEEIKSLGISDAFITVYKNGRKLPPAEAAEYLSR